MPLSYAAVAKAANGGKFNGSNVNEEKLRLRACYGKIQAQIMAEIVKIAPLAEAERHSIYPLLKLPFTLRLRILGYAIDPVTTAFFLPDGNGRKGSALPLSELACHTDERFRLESLMVTIEKSTIEIHSGPANEGMQKWFAQVNFSALGGDTTYKTGFDAVKSLRFPFFSRFPHRKLPANAKNQDINLMLRCKNLATLRISWVDEELTYFYNMDGFLPKPVEQIRREYRLDDMLKVKNLKHLHLASRVTNQVYEASGHVGYRQVEALKKWFDEEFGKRGLKVKVTIS